MVDSMKHRWQERRMTEPARPDAPPDAELDAVGLLCPLPVLKARKRLAALAPGQVLRMLADDPAAVIDVPHFCAEAGHVLIGQTEEGAAQVYLIRKGGTG
jgi:tRNA 2-thiouridine synthesizing protein A